MTRDSDDQSLPLLSMHQKEKSACFSHSSGSTIVSLVILNEKLNFALNYLKHHAQRMASKCKKLRKPEAKNKSRPGFGHARAGKRKIVDRMKGMIFGTEMETDGDYEDLEIMDANAQSGMETDGNYGGLKIMDANAQSEMVDKMELSEIQSDIAELEDMMNIIMEDKLVRIIKTDTLPVDEEDIEEFEEIAEDMVQKWEEREAETSEK
ncbi:hypothetical protein DSL72_003248 [Monilinia vaccinii-corymbosi]|uniref:Uncharacterized protein n=1 Tax=Monilinia vaccinii-corymbosi TaxID=61207 RepID=A0A8A3P0P0_9HELO|nr:hypothetical protein DSL72_003248 [Monilinia vaccinii-corymbosi]